MAGQFGAPVGSSTAHESIMISLVGGLLLLLASLNPPTAHGSPLTATAHHEPTMRRHVGPHPHATNATTTTSSAVEQVAALLRARPRPTHTTTTASKPTVSPATANKAPDKVRPLLAEASTVNERQHAASAKKSNETNATTTARPQPGKRQADFASSGGDPLPPTSRRNEDPWFLDQAPLPLQPYRFSYNIKDKNGLTEQYRQEAGDGKFTTGSYGYVLPDGIYRHVDYVADDRGFHVFLRTTEPGTANQNPADVVINANPVITAPGLSYASVRADAPGGGAGLLPYTPAGFAAGLPPASAWNYSTLLPASAYSPAAQTPPLIDLLRNSAAATNGSRSSSAGSSLASSQLYDGTLARRPPGSIVGTPARNFTSFAYGNQPPSASGAAAWPWSSGQSQRPAGGGDSSAGYQFQSLAPKPAQQALPVQPQTTSGFGANNPTWQQQPYSNWNDRRAGNLNGDDDQRRTSEGGKQSTRGQEQFDRGGGNRDSLGASYPDGAPFSPLSGAGGYFGTTSRLAPLFTPARVGPDVLLYDRPFTVQTSAPGGASALKLNYDNNHVLYADSPFLSLERAKNLAHLEQINAVARLASGQLTSLPLLAGTDGGPSSSSGNLPLADLIRLGLLSGTTSGSQHQSSSREEHHEHQQHASRQLVDEANKQQVLHSKEHRSGSSSASGRELDYDSREPPQQQLPPPPPPQFNTHQQQQHHHHLQPQFKPMGVKGAGEQQSAGRLLAPYVDERQAFAGRPGHAGQVKGGNSQQQQQQQISYDETDQRRQQPTFGPLAPPTPPAEPRTPVEPALPATASDQELPRATTQVAGGTKVSTPSTRRESSSGDEIELREQTGAPPPGEPATGGITRAVRMPDSDYRTSVLMNDLRSMQNSIGLPQPPRLQRSSDHHSSSSSSLIEHPAGGHAHSHPTSGLSLADQMVAARMRRVEDLLRHAHPNPAGSSSSSSSPPQQASVQQAVAVRASRKELDELSARQRAGPPDAHQSLTERSNRTLSLSSSSRQREVEGGGGSLDQADDDQPRRRMSTGPVLKFPAAAAAGMSQAVHEPTGGANDTASFEAQRLSAKAARLRADKVSELEKFQQRLRSQQLHLQEQKISGDSKLASPIAQKQQQQHTIRSNSEANSHVKYDEPNENEILTHQLGGPTADNHQQALLRKRDHQYPRSRRQDEPADGAKVVEKVKDRDAQQTSTTTTTTTTTPAPQVSEFVRKLHSWPSLLGQQQGHPNEVTRSSHKSLESPEGQGNETGNRKQQQVAVTGGGNRMQHEQLKPAGPNTINLDFINSVTALSVDHLNPFAISSVNPAVQRSSSAAVAAAASGQERLSPHRLTLPSLNGGDGLSSRDQQVAAHHSTGQPTSGAPANSAGFVSATSPARYHNSPDLLAALDYHERRDTSNQLRGLLDQTHSNHQSLMGAPYMMQSPLSNHKTANAPLGSRLLIGTGSQLFEAATNSQHKSFMPVPKQLKPMASNENKKEPDNSKNNKPVTSSSSASSTTMRVEPVSSSVQRDGFEIRDRAVQVDNHRFFEVVSSLRDPSETSSAGSFQAFRG